MNKKLNQSGLLFALMLAGASTGQANVEVTKSILGGLSEVERGKTFSYVLQYRNPSTTIPEFYNVTITDPLPPELEYRGFEGTADVNSVNYDSASHTLTIYFNNPLEDGKTGELEVRTAFKPGVTPDGTVALNTATIDADNSPADTSGQVSITARAENLAVLDKILLGPAFPWIRM